MDGWGKGEAQEYQERLQLDKERYGELSETAKRLFNAKRLDVDCRFWQLSDAKDFCEKFCRAVSCRVVSISTTAEYYGILAGELKGSSSHGLIFARQIRGKGEPVEWIPCRLRCHFYN